MTSLSLVWPDTPTCHYVSPVFKVGDIVWRPPSLDPGSVEEKRFCSNYPFRTCSYCGSIHPEDLFNALDDGAKLGGSDWKYGYPHKFYVSNIKSPLTGQMTVREGGDVYKASVEGMAYGKWYNEHLQDITHEFTFNTFRSRLAVRAGIFFERSATGGIQFRAPYHGFQA